MLKTLSAQIKQYKKSTILTPIFAALEVVMEVLIPMAMARLVKYGIEGGDTGAIYRYGFLMMAMAMLSLVFGSVCAHTASHASTGFARTCATACTATSSASRSPISTNTPPPVWSRA